MERWLWLQYVCGIRQRPGCGDGILLSIRQLWHEVRRPRTCGVLKELRSPLVSLRVLQGSSLTSARALNWRSSRLPWRRRRSTRHSTPIATMTWPGRYSAPAPSRPPACCLSASHSCCRGRSRGLMCGSLRWPGRSDAGAGGRSPSGNRCWRWAGAPRSDLESPFRITCHRH